VETVAVRMATWPRRHGFARDDEDSGLNEKRVFTFDETPAQWAIGRGTFERAKGCHGDAQASSETNPLPPPGDGAMALWALTSRASLRTAAAEHGFERLRLLSDARYGYNVKKSGRRASRVRIMMLLECLAGRQTLCAGTAALLSMDAVSRRDCVAR